jgi:DNA polymerase-3 subunit delta'
VQLEELIGQARASAVLRNAILRDRVAHAYLFHGPEGVGKSTAARLFAQALSCERAEGDGLGSICNECRSCQLVAAGTHPDVRLIAPPEDGGASVIPIEGIRRGLVYDINLKPVVGRRKIYILDPADRTAPLAIHTTLKALEEPPPYVVTILVTARPASLPPTIPSRCQEVTFQLAGIDAIERHLLDLGTEPAAAASLARVSGGRVAWAISAARRPEVLAARAALLDLCAALPGRGVPVGLRLAEEIKLQALALARARREGEAERDTEDESEDGAPARAFSPNRELRSELPWCLDVVVSWYRDRLAAAEGGALLNADYETSLRAGPEAHTAQEQERAIRAILETKHSLQRNANVDLALESLAIKLLGGGG